MIAGLRPGRAEARSRSRPAVIRGVAWVGLCLVVLTFYWVEAWVRKTPWLFVDELEWTQLSRSIAATGHAARRGDPIWFKSLYAYLIAPAWWIHSTATAYALIKYLNAVVMCLAAVPTYLLSRLLVAHRTAVAVAVLAIAVPAMSYATSIVPEPLAYTWFALAAWLSVRAVARPTRSAVALAVAVVAVGPFVRKEFVALPISLLLAAAGVWVIHGSERAILRHHWRRTALAAVVVAAGGLLFNWLVIQRVQAWHASQYLNRHTLKDGSIAVGALAIGMGMLPVIAGIGSLRLPERRGDAAYRAFAAYLLASMIAFSVYTAAKATYLAGSAAPLVEERNLFYVSPLLLLGTALVLEARKVDWRLLALATALVVASAWSTISVAGEVGAPYFEAPGLAVLTLVNRDFRWDVNDFHRLLACATAVAVVLIACRRRGQVVAIAGALVFAWMLTGQIYATISNRDLANVFARTLPPPRSWVDQATGGAAVTFLGQRIADPNSLWLTEFWNRSLHHVASLDGSAPGPGPTTAPGLLTADGTLSGYTGDAYTLAGAGVDLQAPLVARRDGFSLYRTQHVWKLLDEESNVFADGWAPDSCAFTYFRKGGPGVLSIDLSRTGYTGDAPAGHATVQVGTVRLDTNGVPQLDHVLSVRHAIVRNGKDVTIDVPVRSTPVTVAIEIRPTFQLPSDVRDHGAQVSFTFFRG